MDIFKLHRKTICRCAAVLWMVLIFSFSGQKADVSNGQSGRISQFLCSTFVSGFSDMSEEQQKHCLEEISYPIRKTAHVSEYAVLALLFFGSIYTAESVHRKKEGPELQIPLFMQPEEHRGEELMKRYEGFAHSTRNRLLWVFLCPEGLRCCCHRRN